VCDGANALRKDKVPRRSPACARFGQPYPRVNRSQRASPAARRAVKKHTYSVPAALIGLKLDAHVGESEVRFTYEGREVCRFPGCRAKNPASTTAT